jgi:phosphoglycolate phosphatase-like HAD superfamily hydrolase
VKNRIIVDVDGTVYDTRPALSEECERLWGRAVAPEEFTHWYALRSRFGSEYFRAYRAILDPARVMDRTPYPGFVYAMERLSSQGYHIHFLSHNEDPDSILPALGEWFDYLLPFVPYDLDVTTSRKCKVKRALELGDVALLIDDKPATIDKALEAGVPVATIEWPYHEQYKAAGKVFIFQDWGKDVSRIEALISDSVLV